MDKYANHVTYMFTFSISTNILKMQHEWITLKLLHIAKFFIQMIGLGQTQSNVNKN